jgi:long-chain acyl-CoA synthetase
VSDAVSSVERASNPADLSTGTLTELFLTAVEKHGSRVAYRYFPDAGNELVDVTFDEVYEVVRAAAAALQALGLTRGDRVAILSENCLEWALADFACMCAGVLDVPIYSTLTVPQVAYILENSQAKLVFVSNGEEAEKALEASREIGREVRVVMFDPTDPPAEQVLVWRDFLEHGRNVAADGDQPFRAAALEAGPEDVATILYTSGTTGKPKGVILTHNNLSSNVQAVQRILPPLSEDTSLVFLPLSHVLQRMVSLLHFSDGVTQTFAHSMDTVAEDLTIVRPSVAVSVPRLYEKVFNEVMEVQGIKKKFVQWAREVGEAWADQKLAGREPSGVLKMVYSFADALVFRKIREAMGGRIRYFVSGGAPLSPEINRFFYSAGIQIFEGYGLTETSPVTNLNTPEHLRIGTVGRPIPGTEIRLGEGGEILIRGPQVMRGYYELPEATAEAIDAEGWFHTGDVGEIDEDGFLKITDRIKDIIVTAGGKNVAPQPIENRLKGDDFIEQAVMLGDREAFCVLLVVPSFPNLEAWARKKGINAPDRKALLASTQVQDQMEGRVMACVEDLANYERPKKIGLLEAPFTVDDGTLTPTQKVKRREVEARYRTLIDAFYQKENFDQTVFVEA